MSVSLAVSVDKCLCLDALRIKREQLYAKRDLNPLDLNLLVELIDHEFLSLLQSSSISSIFSSHECYEEPSKLEALHLLLKEMHLTSNFFTFTHLEEQILKFISKIGFHHCKKLLDQIRILRTLAAERDQSRVRKMQKMLITIAPNDLTEEQKAYLLDSAAEFLSNGCDEHLEIDPICIDIAKQLDMHHERSQLETENQKIIHAEVMHGKLGKQMPKRISLLIDEKKSEILAKKQVVFEKTRAIRPLEEIFSLFKRWVFDHEKRIEDDPFYYLSFYHVLKSAIFCHRVFIKCGLLSSLTQMNQIHQGLSRVLKEEDHYHKHFKKEFLKIFHQKVLDLKRLRLFWKGAVKQEEPALAFDADTESEEGTLLESFESAIHVIWTNPHEALRYLKQGAGRRFVSLWAIESLCEFIPKMESLLESWSEEHCFEAAKTLNMFKEAEHKESLSILHQKESKEDLLRGMMNLAL